MAESVLVDAGFIVALLSRRDTHHKWAASQARRHPPPWQTCDAVLSESFHLLGEAGRAPLAVLLGREALLAVFSFRDNRDDVLRVMEKYSSVPASLADGCLVRMTETLPGPILLTTDTDFRNYRRHGRQVIPIVMPAASGS